MPLLVSAASRPMGGRQRQLQIRVSILELRGGKQPAIVLKGGTLILVEYEMQGLMCFPLNGRTFEVGMIRGGLAIYGNLYRAINAKSRLQKQPVLRGLVAGCGISRMKGFVVCRRDGRVGLPYNVREGIP